MAKKPDQNSSNPASRLKTVAPTTGPSQLHDRSRSTSTESKRQDTGFVLEDPEEVDVSLADHVRRGRYELSSILISFITHTALLVALALIVFASQDAQTISIMADISDNEPVAEQFENATETIEIIAPEEAESPIEMDETELATDEELLTPEIDSSLMQQPSESTSPAERDQVSPLTQVQSLPTGGGLEGRNAEARARLAARYGGSEASEAAVERGIRWILAHQDLKDGSWHLRHNGGECNGRCQNNGMRESTTAATGLSLLAILGAGYTHQTGPYQDQVLKGLQYLVSKMNISTHGGSLAETSMYDHAIATLALSEVLIMTDDPSLRGTVELAMQYIVSAQHKQGGWRYVAGNPGDMTVTGWQVMALKSCARAGIHAPPSTLEKAEAFIASLGESDGSYYGYQKPDNAPVPTAVGQLSRMFLGWSKDKGQLQLGSEFLADLAPSPHDVYFNYYSTQVLFHLQTERWPRWNERLREHLIATQETAGHQDGSWYFDGEHNRVGGRLYTTAMCIMTLEVYYRYLPLYDSELLQ